MFVGIKVVIMTISVFLFGSARNSAAAQSSPQQVMAGIYQKYDSINFLSFDVSYIYTTDTAYGDFSHEKLDGSYTMAGKRAKYNIGDIEFMQNDSFFIAVYTQQKMIVVADPHSDNSGNELPMRKMIDSIINFSGQHYTISNYSDTSTGILRFDRTDSLADFDLLKVAYDTTSNLLKSIKYVYTEMQVLNPEDTTGAPPKIIPRHKSLEIEFSNYRVDNLPDELYNENSYVWFENGECKPVQKYADYKVYYAKTALAPGSPEQGDR